MSARFLSLAAAALLAISPAVGAKPDPRFELDVVFPRNETYTTQATRRVLTWRSIRGASSTRAGSPWIISI